MCCKLAVNCFDAQSDNLWCICRHAHLQQQLLKEDVQLLHPPQTPASAPIPAQSLSEPTSRTADSNTGQSFSSGECEIGIDPHATGVMHVGLLRAGAARQVVVALADKQVAIYRENGKTSHTAQPALDFAPCCYPVVLLKQTCRTCMMSNALCLLGIYQAECMRVSDFNGIIIVSHERMSLLCMQAYIDLAHVCPLRFVSTALFLLTAQTQ